jgi:hypothetical protein
MPLELVLLEAVKTAMDMPPSVTEKDAVLTQLIRGVSQDFEDMTGRIVDVGAQLEIFDVTRYFDHIYLKAWPVLIDDPTLTFKIFNDTERVFGAETEVDSSNYYVEQEKGLVDFFNRFPIAKKSLVASYTGGMAVMTDPSEGEEFWNLYPDVAEAVTLEVIEEFKSIPNLGAAATKIGPDTTQMFPRRSRSKLFKGVVKKHGRVIL